MEDTHKVNVDHWVEHDEINATGYYKEGCQITVNGDPVCIDFNPYDRTTFATKLKSFLKAFGVENVKVSISDKRIEI